MLHHAKAISATPPAAVAANMRHGRGCSNSRGASKIQNPKTRLAALSSQVAREEGTCAATDGCQRTYHHETAFQRIIFRWKLQQQWPGKQQGADQEIGDTGDTNVTLPGFCAEHGLLLQTDSTATATSRSAYARCRCELGAGATAPALEKRPPGLLSAFPDKPALLCRPAVQLRGVDLTRRLACYVWVVTLEFFWPFSHWHLGRMLNC